MKTPRPFLPILLAVLFGGIAHAGEFSLGGGHLLAQNSAQPSVDVSITFTDRGPSMREAEGGDRETPNTRSMRGADDTSASTPATPRDEAAPAPKSTEPAPITSDSPHGVSISPAAAIRRPSYRWQSLVPGTIK